MMCRVTNEPADPRAVTPNEPTNDSASHFERLGGHDFFDRLVGRFYAGVSADSELRAMYPDQDLGPAERRLRMFLEQYWGGPTTYSDERGHPRLRMRHAAFHIDSKALDHWLTHMLAALDAEELPDDLDEDLRVYLIRAAYSMVNQPDPL